MREVVEELVKMYDPDLEVTEEEIILLPEPDPVSDSRIAGFLTDFQDHGWDLPPEAEIIKAVVIAAPDGCSRELIEALVDEFGEERVWEEIERLGAIIILP